VLLLGIELASKLFGLVFFIIMARFLGARELGIYAFAMALANFFVIAPRFGFEKMVQREIGRSGHLLKGYFLELTAVKGMVSTAALGVLFPVLWLVSSNHVTTGMIISFFVFAYAYLEFLNSIFRGLQRAEYEVISRSIFSVFNLCAGVAILWHGGKITAVALGQVASVTTAILASLLLLKPYIVDSRPEYQWGKLLDHVGKAAPLGGVLVALYFSNQMGVLVLGAMTGETETGYFAASMRLFDNLTLIAAALMGAFLPRASDLYVRSREEFSDAAAFVMRQVFLLAFPMAAGMVVLAEPITLLLYGSGFSPAVMNVKILGPALLFSYWNYMADSILIATDRERLLFRLTCLAALIHVASNLVFVYWYSHVGAALAVAVTQGFYCILLAIHIRGAIPLKGFGAFTWKPALCALGMGCLVYTLKGMHLALLIPLGAGVYFVGLMVTGCLDLRDFRMLGASFSGKVLEK
jgi:O-antigen/teichoic acid export membrane protein